MNRRRVLLFTVTFVLALFAACGWWLHRERQQYALNRQLIDVLVKGDTKTALTLVNEGADPNTRYAPSPQPTLEQVWKQLIHRETVPANDTPTALMFACGMRYFLTYEEGVPPTALPENLPLLRAMLLHKATIDLRATDNESVSGGEHSTALLRAVKSERWHTVELLLQHGADVNAQDEQGTTSLMMVARYGNVDTVRMLLAHKGNPNLPDANGNTVLHYAVLESSNPSTIPTLLAYGADLNKSNKYGETPLTLAHKMERPAQERLLKRGLK